jgi:hypothetical protein
MAFATIDAIGPAIGPTLSQEGYGRELSGTCSRDYDLRNSDGGHVYIYTFFRVRKLRSEERLAAIARGGCADGDGTFGSSAFASIGNSAGGREQSDIS